jgi:PhnB protein
MAVHELFAYLRLRDPAAAIDFYVRAFGAEELFRLVEPSGRIGHAELRLGGTILMLSDEFPEFDVRGPASIGGTSVAIHLHVDDADALIARAAECGAQIVRPATDRFHGERSGTVRDPFGHEWLIGHSLEELTPQEMQRRYTRMLSDCG